MGAGMLWRSRRFGRPILCLYMGDFGAIALVFNPPFCWGLGLGEALAWGFCGDRADFRGQYFVSTWGILGRSRWSLTRPFAGVWAWAKHWRGDFVAIASFWAANASPLL
ncbi:MAG: hypothetical protein ACO34J_12135 [Prochlorothrix sp.]